MTGRLDGKKALVTGGAQGLGAAIAERLAAEGAQVLVTDLNEAGAGEVAAGILSRYPDSNALSLRHDVTSEEDWKAAVAMAEESMGGLSVLVNNAGVITTGSVEDLSLERWHRDMAINVDSVFLGCREALPLMRLTQPGSIINIASISSLIASHNFASYNASKAAVWMLTKSVGVALCKTRLRHPLQLDPPGVHSHTAAQRHHSRPERGCGGGEARQRRAARAGRRAHRCGPGGGVSRLG